MPIWVGTHEFDACVDILGKDPNRLWQPGVMLTADSQADFFNLRIVKIL